MTDEKRKQILDKISKLAAITNKDSGAFQGEMNNAAALIQKLMDEYAITWAEVNARAIDQQNAEVEAQFRQSQGELTIKGIKQWHWKLARLVARITHTRQYSTGYRSHNHMCFYGTETAAAAASQLFDEWCVVIEMAAQDAYNKRFFELADKYGRGAGLMDRVPEHERTTYFKPNFLEGCVAGMAKVIDEKERERSASDKKALMVIENQLTVRYNNFSKGFRAVHSPGSRAYNEAGYSRGLQYGSSIDISAKKIGNSGGKPKASSTKLLKG